MPANPTPTGLIPYVLLPKRLPPKRKSSNPPNASNPPLSKRRRRSLSASGSAAPRIVYTVEDDDLIVPGESPDAGDLESVPVRLLDDFAVYELKSRKLVPIDSLFPLMDDSPPSLPSFSASGIVSAWTDDEGQSDEDTASNGDPSPGVRVKLGQIKEFNIHFVDRRPNIDQPLDHKIYICTSCAWYILGQPSAEYSTQYADFWLKHRTLNMLVQFAYDNRFGADPPTFADFANQIKELPDVDPRLPCANDILGRGIEKADLANKAVRKYLLKRLPDISKERTLSIKRLPLIREILENSTPQHVDGDYLESDEDSDYTSDITSVQTIGPTSLLPGATGQTDVDTYVTPTVRRVAERITERTLGGFAVNGSDDNRSESSKTEPAVHPFNPDKVEFEDEFDEDNRWSSARIDGTLYRAGDVVMVVADPSEEVHAESKTTNKYGNEMWFCRIGYFTLDNQGQKVFHAVWFTHGCRTILQQTSHPQALFLLNDCDNLPVSCLIQKITLEHLKPGDQEEAEHQDTVSTAYHCRFLYDRETASFTDLPIDLVFDKVPEYPSCFSCDADSLDGHLEPRLNGRTLRYQNMVFHQHEFVYLRPWEGDCLEVGQILKFETQRKKGEDNVKIEVRMFARLSDKLSDAEKQKGTYFDDQHEFVRLSSTRIISCDELDGKCYMKYLTTPKAISKWVAQDDHFYFNKTTSLDNNSKLEDIVPPFPNQYCVECMDEDADFHREQQQFRKQVAPLVGMELFSGAGGLSTGLELSGFVKTKYAVEFAPSAAKTHQKNHPETTVYCQDTNILLKSAVEEFTEPVISRLDHKPCPPMPAKGPGIDFIYGGPPCQPFSKMNHSKYRDDPRSLLPLNMLSYVEHYEPDYFLLENVAGLWDHELVLKEYDSEGKPTNKSSKMSRGMVKVIIRVLVALGYQVRFQLLQAAQYGVPQGRKRFIFWGAKSGLKIPEFPKPTHCYNGHTHGLRLPDSNFRRKEPEYRSHNKILAAPFPAITIDMALSDLPPFEWENPHKTLSRTKLDIKEADRRKREGIQAFPAVRRGPMGENAGFTKGIKYSQQPKNRYQALMRRGMDEHAKVTAHYTATFLKDDIVEIVVNVPLFPGACHRNVKRSLLPPYTTSTKNKDREYYGRLGGNSHFKCALTSMNPGAKGSYVIHPNQKRIFSVREFARAQGFPDDYIFESVADRPSVRLQDQIRQIGNAVAVPFAMVLGKELGKALIQDWHEKRRQGSEEL